MKLFLLALIALCCVLQTNAQVVFTHIQSPTQNKQELPFGAVVVAPPTNIIDALARSTTMQLPWVNGALQMNIVPFTVLTENATVELKTINNSISVPIPTHFMVRGTIHEKKNSSVFLAAFNDYCFGVFQWDEPGKGRITLLLQPYGAYSSGGTLVLRDVSSAKPKPYNCFAEELEGYQRKTDSIMKFVASEYAFENKISEDIQVSATRAVHVALECNYSYFKRADSSVSKSVCYALALIGASSSIYTQDARIELRVPFLRVWTEPDPYPGDIGDKLTKLRTVWEDSMKYVQRSVTCMLSGEGGGGLAYVGVLCNSFGYNVCGVDASYNFPQDDYLWDVDVFSHELGHNIGSPHTHNCSWAPAIDSCWNAEGGCFKFKTPRRGSIMSYCHLQNQGTSLLLHPRVASLMQRAVANSPCVETVPVVHDTDIAIQQLLLPRAGAVLSTQRLVVPTAIVKNNGQVPVQTVVRFRFLTAKGEVRYISDEIAVTVPINASAQVSSGAGFTMQTGTYVAEVVATTPGDKRAVNNALSVPFTVQNIPVQSIGVIKPNGGEIWNANEQVVISYVQSGVKNVRLELSTNNGSTWQTLRFSSPTNSQEIAVIVPPVSSNQCLVRVTSLENSEVLDVSDGTFRIVTENDLEVIDILSPEKNTTVASPLIPRVIVRNNGKNVITDADVDISFRWVNSSAERALQTVKIARIGAGVTDTVIFASTPVLANGKHVVKARCRAPQDQNTENDTKAWEFTSTGLNAPYGVQCYPANNRVVVVWKNTANANIKTEVWRGSTALDAQRIATMRSSVECYVDTTVKNSQLYVYQLRNVDQSRNSIFSELCFVKPEKYGVEHSFNAPLLLSPQNGQLDLPLPIQLRWSHQSRECSFEVQLANDAAFTDKYYVTVTSNEGYLQPPVQFGTTTYWRVRALAPGYTGPWSSVNKYTTTAVCAGNKLSFDGKNQQAVAPNFLWEGGEVTVEFWTFVQSNNIKPSSAFGLGERDDVSNRFQAHVPWDNNRVYWDYGDINNGGRVETSFEGYTDKWTHVALVSNGTSFQGIYLDGKLVASSNKASTPGQLNRLVLGALNNGGFLNGSIDEFRIWNVVRTEEEIQENMNQRIDKPLTLPNLKGYWPMISSAEKTIQDATAFSNVLNITSDEMVLVSDAPISCSVQRSLESPRINEIVAKGSGEYIVSWNEIPRAQWYELRVGDNNSKRIVSVQNIAGSTPTYKLRGFPVDSSLRVSIRACAAGFVGLYAERTVTTRKECVEPIINFNRLFTAIADSFVFTGRASTIEYWTLVDSKTLRPASAFTIGTDDVLKNRFQAHTPWEDKTLYFDYGNIETTGRLTTPVDKYLDAWMHIALVSDGVQNMRVYINGELQSESSFSSVPTNLTSLSIGGFLKTNNLHMGPMHDFRIWNVARTADRIREDMYTHIASSDELLGSWMLYDGASDSTYDATEYQNTAVGTKLEWASVPTGTSPIPLKIIVSRKTVAQGDTVRYSTYGYRTANYSWTITNGKIVSGGGRSEISVVWDSSAALGTIQVTRFLAGGCTDAETLFVQLRPTGVAENSNTKALPSVPDYILYPNPTSNSTTLFINNRSVIHNISIVSTSGECVEHYEVPSGTAEFRIPTQALATGAYTCVVSAEHTTKYLRFIKY